MNHGVPAFSPSATSVTINRQVVSGRREPLTGNILKPAVMILCIALVIVLAVSQFMRMTISESMTELSILQTVHSKKWTTLTELRVERARITQKDVVVAAAGERMKLYLPIDGQVHKLRM